MNKQKPCAKCDLDTAWCTCDSTDYEKRRDAAAEATTHHARKLSPNEQDIWSEGADWGRADRDIENTIKYKLVDRDNLLGGKSVIVSEGQWCSLMRQTGSLERELATARKYIGDCEYEHPRKTIERSMPRVPQAAESSQVFTAKDFHSKGPLQLLFGLSTKAIECDEAAMIANILLQERSTKVYGELSKGAFKYKFGEVKCSGDTITALLIGVKPIEKESEERQLLREFVAETGAAYRDNSPRLEAVRERARRLFDGPAKSREE